MKFYIKILPLLLFAISDNIHALDIKITSKSVEGHISIEDNKSFDFFADCSVIGEAELNNKYKIRSGLSLGILDDNVDLKYFVSLNASPFTKVPLDFSLFWIYNGLFEYELHSHSIIPTATYNWKRISLSFGCNFRFSSFLGEDSILEIIPIYSFYWNIYKNESLRFDFICRNYNEFKTRNFPDYSYNFITYMQINDNWQIINNIDILQNGAFVTFTESLYGISFKLGARYSW